MEAFFLLIFVLIMFVHFRNKVSRLSERVQELEMEIRTPNRIASGMPKASAVSGPPVPAAPPSPVVSQLRVRHEIPAPPPPSAVFTPPPPPTPRVSVKLAGPSSIETRFAGFRKQLAENWTGILGAVILVIGVGFFGILGSLMLGPEGRFGIILAAAVVLYGIKYWLARFPAWQAFGSWLQSTSGAILLFAAVGAGGFPGLKFIESPTTALAVLGAGILINLFFAYSVSAQVAASLHVILSLGALLVAPAASFIFIVGTVVAVAGCALCYRSRWDFHLFFCLVGYAVFEVVWQSHTSEPLSTMRLPGIAGALAVGITAGFVHYRKQYQSAKFEWLPFVVHVLNWSVLGIGLLHYAGGSRLTLPALALAAIGASAMGRFARRRKIRWLFVTDTLMGQLLMLLAVRSLGKFGFSDLEVAIVALIETLVFTAVANLEREKVLLRFGYPIQWAMFGVVAGISSMSAFSPDRDIALQTGARLVVAAFLGLGFATVSLFRYWIQDGLSFVFKNSQFNDDRHVSLTAVIAPLLFAFAGYAMQSIAPKLGVGVLALSPLTYFWLANTSYRKCRGGLFLFVAILGQAFALFTISHFTVFGLNLQERAVTGLLETLFFALAVSWSTDRRVLVFSRALSWAVAGFALLCGMTDFESTHWSEGYRGASLLVVSGSMTWLYLFILRHYDLSADDLKGEKSTKYSPVERFSILSFLVPFFITAGFLAVRHTPWATTAATILFLAVAVYRARWENRGWNFGFAFALLLLHGAVWYQAACYLDSPFESWAKLTFVLWRGIPLAVLGGILLCRNLLYFQSRKLFGFRPFVYVSAIHLALTVYGATSPFSDFAPGVGYLLLSLIALELGRFTMARKSPEQGGVVKPYGALGELIVQIGYGFLGLFLVRHVLVHLQSEVALAGMPVRGLIGGFGLGVIFYWLVFPVPAPSGPTSKVNRVLNAYLLEVILSFLTLCLCVEVDSSWHPVLWAAIALALVGIGSLSKSFKVTVNVPSRIRFYAWLFNLAASVQLAAVSSQLFDPSLSIFHDTRILGPLSILLQFGFIAFAYRGRIFLKTMEFPVGLGWLGSLQTRFLQKRQNLFVFYPFALGLAIFLYWRFDKAILTLLWVVEIFAVFLLGMFVREKHFIHVALSALVICIGRLLFFDLSQTVIAVRALVFVMIGVIMLLINAIYRKYRSRFPS